LVVLAQEHAFRRVLFRFAVGLPEV
jgi:hypothetical protein